MSSDGVPDGRFTKAHPSTRRCGSTQNHDPHTDRVVENGWGGPRGMWYACPGWQTTHTVTVTAADGRVVGTQAVDLRELTNPDRYLGTNSPELTLRYDARESGRELTTDELEFGVATAFVAPEVCPYDCDGCHEHLYGLQEELESARG